MELELQLQISAKIIDGKKSFIPFPKQPDQHLK